MTSSADAPSRTHVLLTPDLAHVLRKSLRLLKQHPILIVVAVLYRLLAAGVMLAAGVLAFVFLSAALAVAPGSSESGGLRVISASGIVAIGAGAILLVLLSAAYLAGWENLNNHVAEGRRLRLSVFWQGVHRFWGPILGGTILLWIPGGALTILGGFFLAWAASGPHFSDVLVSLSDGADLAYYLGVVSQDFDLAAYYRVAGVAVVWLAAAALLHVAFAFWRQAVVAGGMRLFPALSVAVGFVVRHLVAAVAAMIPWALLVAGAGIAFHYLSMATGEGMGTLAAWAVKAIVLSVILAYFRLTLFVFYREGIRAEEALEADTEAPRVGAEEPSEAEAADTM